MTPQPDAQSSVRAYVRFVRDHWRLIVAVTVLTAAMAFALSSQREKQYRTSLQVLFRETTIGQQVAGVPVFEAPQTSPSAGAEMTTNVTLLASETVARSVLRQLDLRTDVPSLLERVAVEQVGSSNIGQITVRATDPREAQRIADTWGQTFISQRRQADQAKLGGAIALLNDRLAATPPSELQSEVARQTRQQLQRLELLKAVQDGNAEVVLPAALPTQAYSPRVERTVIIAAVLGALLGLGLAGLRRALDRRVKDSEDVGALLGLPILAEVSSAAFGNAATLASAEGGASEVWQSTEEFRTLATNLRYIGDVEHRRTIAITSAVPDEGKTTVATYLAVTLATMGRRVALVDGDLRRGRIHTYFGIDPNRGVTSLAAGLTSPADAWEHVSLRPEGRELAVLPAGPPAPDPVQILESRAVSQLVRDARDRFDYVLVDTPPVLVVSDALAVSRRVDAALVVVRVGRTTRDQLKRLETALDQVGVRPIGVVVTGVKRKSAYYTAAYEYSPREPPPDVALEPSQRQ